MRRSRSFCLATATASLSSISLVLALTVGKAWVSVPGVWDAQAHQVRQVRLNPFETFQTFLVWWGPWLNLVGNIALFVPVGYVAYAARVSVVKAVAWGAALSLAVETAQYVWALGYSDLDDFLFNVLGAWLGARGASISKGPVGLWLITAFGAVVVAGFVALGLGV